MAADIDDNNDGTLDEADAFPLDSRYVLDADLDELPDEWESLYGLDTTNARSDLETVKQTAIKKSHLDLAGNIGHTAKGPYKS